MFGYIEVYANDIHLINIGVYPHKYIGHEDNVQTGGVVRVRLSGMSGLSVVLRKTTFKLIFIGDIYFDTSKCRLRGD